MQNMAGENRKGRLAQISQPRRPSKKQCFPSYARHLQELTNLSIHTM